MCAERTNKDEVYLSDDFCLMALFDFNDVVIRNRSLKDVLVGPFEYANILMSVIRDMHLKEAVRNRFVARCALIFGGRQSSLTRKLSRFI